MPDAPRHPVLTLGGVVMMSEEDEQDLPYLDGLARASLAALFWATGDGSVTSESTEAGRAQAMLVHEAAKRIVTLENQDIFVVAELRDEGAP